MKKVILMRHAKSSWDNSALTDHERPLNSRGVKDAPFIDSILISHAYRPDLILSSDSARTRQTLDLMPNFRTIDHSFERQLYHASAEKILDIIHNAPPYIETLMLLAHNPGITEAVYKLCRMHIHNVPTSGVAIIDLAVDDYTLFEPGNGKLIDYFYPKMKDQN